ncbi:hypothetical protein Adu01nite_91720 [Paractinoplanes durhamensis]|uniref:Uncharacterized protein n=1 Tax=Paractinoplanes durhamensis TaxID=113563 RepID=A0ABQ3ZDE4_9ACTN|nr:hypothetical protein Adu01nite_91720 [Actinoplanes durhamensis]
MLVPVKRPLPTTCSGVAALGRHCDARTVIGVNDLEGALLFAGVPLAVLGLVFAIVFRTSDKPSREPITKPVMDDDRSH